MVARILHRRLVGEACTSGGEREKDVGNAVPVMNPADLNLVLLVATCVLLAGVAAVRISSRAGLPSLLLYLLIGLVIGEAGLGIKLEDFDLVQVVGT